MFAFDVRLTILVTVTLFITKSSANNPSIPCPSLFKYEKVGDKSFGLITVNVTFGKTKLECVFSNIGWEPNFAQDFHLTIPTDKIYESILSGNPFTYRIEFINNSMPIISEIKLNDVLLCIGPKYPAPSSTMRFTHTTTGPRPADPWPVAPPQNIPSRISLPVFNSKPTLSSNHSNIPADLWSTFAKATAEFSNRPKSSNSDQNFTRNTEQLRTRFSHAKDNPFFNHAFDMTRIQDRTLPFAFPVPITTKPLTATPVTTTTTTVKPFLFTQPQTFTQLFATPPPADRDTLSMEQINSICGQENYNFVVNTLSFNGKRIIRSRFPWIAAIFKKNRGTLSFQCGGSLISSRTVVTAAHCFYNDYDLIRDEDILISMGRHNLTDWTDSNIVHADPLRIIQHPDYRPELPKTDADLAIVLFKNRVPFTLAIRPICLWQGTIDPEYIVGRLGTVVGWGRDQHNAVTTSPRLVNARVVSEITCIRSSEDLYQLTSNRTLCAGERDGSGPCDGDSGSGLMILKSRKWMLRGTVSAALGSGVNRCNLDEYVIYTDVAKFINWIHANMLL